MSHTVCRMAFAVLFPQTPFCLLPFDHFQVRFFSLCARTICFSCLIPISYTTCTLTTITHWSVLVFSPDLWPAYCTSLQVYLRHCLSSLDGWIDGEWLSLTNEEFHAAVAEGRKVSRITGSLPFFPSLRRFFVGPDASGSSYVDSQDPGAVEREG